jgi:hypothetical protein
VDEAVPQLLAELPAYTARVAALPNRAVFEVPELLAGILARHGAQAASASSH